MFRVGDRVRAGVKIRISGSIDVPCCSLRCLVGPLVLPCFLEYCSVTCVVLIISFDHLDTEKSMLMNYNCPY